MPWAARAGVDPRRGSFFVHKNMGNLLLGRGDARPRQKRNFEGSGAIDLRKLAAGIWHGQNSEQRRLRMWAGLYGWSYLLSSQAHT